MYIELISPLQVTFYLLIKVSRVSLQGRSFNLFLEGGGGLGVRGFTLRDEI